jgi:hypothetical protein
MISQLSLGMLISCSRQYRMADARATTLSSATLRRAQSCQGVLASATPYRAATYDIHPSRSQAGALTSCGALKLFLILQSTVSRHLDQLSGTKERYSRFASRAPYRSSLRSGDFAARILNTRQSHPLVDGIYHLVPSSDGCDDAVSEPTAVHLAFQKMAKRCERPHAVANDFADRQHRH